MLSMILDMLCLTFENHQIRWIIIPLVAINVMDYFTFPEWSTKHLLSYYSVCMSSMTFLISQTFTSTKLSLSTLFLDLFSHPGRIQLSIHLSHMALSAAEVMLRSPVL